MNASLKPIDAFGPRHIGPSAHRRDAQEAIGRSSLEDLCDHAVPEGIRYRGTLTQPAVRRSPRPRRSLVSVR